MPASLDFRPHMCIFAEKTKKVRKNAL